MNMYSGKQSFYWKYPKSQSKMETNLDKRISVGSLK